MKTAKNPRPKTRIYCIPLKLTESEIQRIEAKAQEFGMDRCSFLRFSAESTIEKLTFAKNS